MRIKSAQQPHYIKRALAAQNQAPCKHSSKNPTALLFTQHLPYHSCYCYLLAETRPPKLKDCTRHRLHCSPQLGCASSSSNNAVLLRTRGLNRTYNRGSSWESPAQVYPIQLQVINILHAAFKIREKGVFYICYWTTELFMLPTQPHGNFCAH